MVLLKKTDSATEISGIENDYVTNASLSSQLSDLKKQHIADDVKRVDDKATKNSSDFLGFESRLKKKVDTLGDVQREASYFRGKNYYDSDGLQNYFVFNGIFTSFKRSGYNITSWKSTGLYDYNKDNAVKLDAVNYSAGLAPKLTTASENGKLNVRFSVNVLKQPKIHYNHGKIIDIYVTCKLRKRAISSPDFTVQNAFFGAAKLTKDAYTSHYGYSGYGICFDSGSGFSFGNSLTAKNVIMFGCDMSFSSHANNRVNNIYVLGKTFIQGINGTTLYAEKLYNIDCIILMTILIYLLMVWNN